MGNSKKNILIIGTGGTIAGTGKLGKTCDYDSGKLKLNDLVSKIPEINVLANIKYIDMFNVDSCDMNFENLIKISEFINKNSQDSSIDGFVITHGTDTLEESAYFLNLVIKTSKPVVITGSMRPSTSLSSDGCLNLYQAVALASCPEACNKGVLIAFGDGIYGARDVQKASTFKTGAFSHKDLGSLGFIRDNQVFFYNISTKIHTLNTDFDINNINLNKIPNVNIVYFYLGASEKILDYFCENSDGLVIACAGSGTVSKNWCLKINKLINNNYPIVYTSKINNGLVNVGLNNKNKIICAHNLTAEKSRILLLLSLINTREIDEIQKYFDRY